MRFSAFVSLLWCMISDLAMAGDLKVGAAAVNLQADDSMVISGGIGPRYAKGQEGGLRASGGRGGQDAARIEIDD